MRCVMLCCACREGQYLDATGGSFRAFMEGNLESFPGTQAMPTLLPMCVCCKQPWQLVYVADQAQTLGHTLLS